MAGPSATGSPGSCSAAASYTAYTFIAIPALVYGVGAIGFFAIPFALFTTPLVYLVSTRIWSVSHAHGFVIAAEFVRARFGSRSLATVVALVGIVATMPYIAVQLIALQAVLQGGRARPASGRCCWRWRCCRRPRSAVDCGRPALLSIAQGRLLIWLLLSAALVVAMSGGWGATLPGRRATGSASDASAPSNLLLLPSGQLAYLTLIIGSALSIFAYPHAMVGILAGQGPGHRATQRRRPAALRARARR